MKFRLLLLLALFPFISCAQESFAGCEPDSVPGRIVSAKTGSHHSLSYSKPAWYWIPFNWMTKCQSLDLMEQIKAGVTYFDIRVRFKKDKIISGHGMMDYNVDVLQALKTLNDCSSAEIPFYVRIMYESKPFCKNPSIEEMKAFMAQLKQDYPCLIFTPCHIRNPYTLVETNTPVPKKDCYMFYKDYGAKTLWKKLKGLKLPRPKYYARRNNKKYSDQQDNEIIYIYDFVEFTKK
jgi:hypothetical protein